MLKQKIGAILLSLGMATGIGAVGTVATATPALASHTCVDGYEYNNVYYGNKLGVVERFWDTHGWVRWQNGDWLQKRYYACGRYYTYVQAKYWWNGYAWKLYSTSRW